MGPLVGAMWATATGTCPVDIIDDDQEGMTHMSDPENGNSTDTPGESTKKTTRSKSASQSNSGSGSSASGSTAQATAVVGSAVSTVRERLVAGEQLVLIASLVIVAIVYLLFEFLLNFRVVSNFAVIVAVLTTLAIWVHRWGHYDFGSAYRIIVAALGLSLALFAVLNLLAWARAGGGADFLRLIGLLIYWISGIAAGYGAWLVFRLREE